jgi:hypothetical protein
MIFDNYYCERKLQIIDISVMIKTPTKSSNFLKGSGNVTNIFSNKTGKHKKEPKRNIYNAIVRGKGPLTLWFDGKYRDTSLTKLLDFFSLPVPEKKFS